MFKKQVRALLIAAAAVIILSGTASAYADQSMRVLFTDGSKSLASVTTQAKTVGEFLEENEIIVGEYDILTPAADTQVEKQMRISIERAFEVTVKIGNDAPVQVLTTTMPLYEFVSVYAKRTESLYVYDKTKWHRDVTPEQIILLTKKVGERLEVREDIPFTTIHVETTALTRGVEQVAEEGKDGVKLFVYEVMKANNVELSRTLELEQVETMPVTRVIMVGTGEPVAPTMLGRNGTMIPAFEHTSVLTMNASAYTADYASTGKRPGDKLFGICATGMRAQYGVVAVDPKVIPLHTKLYIEGYGFAIAGDTGGAIKGQKIDLFFNTNAEVKQFGRRNITVYILQDQNMDLGFDPFK